MESSISIIEFILSGTHFFEVFKPCNNFQRPSWWASWSWSYGSWINYLCNQCLSPLTTWVRISLRRSLLNTTLCDKGISIGLGLWCLTSPSTTFQLYRGGKIT